MTDTTAEWLAGWSAFAEQVDIVLTKAIEEAQRREHKASNAASEPARLLAVGEKVGLIAVAAQLAWLARMQYPMVNDPNVTS